MTRQLKEQSNIAELWRAFNTGATEDDQIYYAIELLKYWRSISLDIDTCRDLLLSFKSRTNPQLGYSELTQILKSVYEIN